MLPPTGIGGGRYVMGKTLGEGTFGQVRLGCESRTGETVAIKVLERARIVDKDARARLRNEIAILRQVEHNSLLRLLEVVEDADATYLVTEHVGGGELFTYIDKNGHLSEREASQLFAQMLSAVDSFHALGVIHRDLKPENMLLDTAARELKIIDFGLGTLLSSADEVLTAACGSPHYAAPEMLIGDGYTGRRSDMWSLGVCLYALLCGCLPFDEEDMEILYDKIIAGDFNFDGCPDLSPEATNIIKGLLNTDPKRRLTAAAALEHSFIRNHQPGGALGDRVAVLAGSTTDLARAGVLRALSEEFGMSKAEVVEKLAKGERCYETALYFLVRQREIKHGRAIDQPNFLPTPPPPRTAEQTRRPVLRPLRDAPTAFAARQGLHRTPAPKLHLPTRAHASEGTRGAGSSGFREDAQAGSEGTREPGSEGTRNGDGGQGAMSGRSPVGNPIEGSPGNSGREPGRGESERESEQTLGQQTPGQQTLGQHTLGQQTREQLPSGEAQLQAAPTAPGYSGGDARVSSGPGLPVSANLNQSSLGVGADGGAAEAGSGRAQGTREPPGSEAGSGRAQGTREPGSETGSAERVGGGQSWGRAAAAVKTGDKGKSSLASAVIRRLWQR
mmetsp:Transcript_3949/g.10037  ORF Transcript_3949/g.10037 Transcript_3949/m.10037 type:complete len:617 (-) Transcript_3949:47-1897(-)